MKSLTRFLLKALGCLPLSLLHGGGSLLGTLLWWLPNNLKAVTLRHLELCLPELDEGQRRRLARQSLVQSMQAVLEAPAIWFGPETRLRRWVDVPQARDQLLAASAQGAIILCPHIGSWELAGMFCAAHGGIASLYKPQKGVMDELILEGRSRLGAALVPTNAAGVKGLLQQLRGGGKIGVLPDHDPPPGSGEFALLFGIPAHTTVLVSRLAGRVGLPVWFCYAERLSGGRGFSFHLRQAPAGVAETGLAGVTALNQGIETVIRHLPGQYWWSYKRYRRRPPGGENLYAGL